MIHKSVRLDEGSATFIKRFAQGMGMTEGEAMRAIIHRYWELSAHREAMAVEAQLLSRDLDRATQKAEQRRGTERTHPAHKG